MAIPNEPCYLIINYPPNHQMLNEHQIEHLIKNGDLDEKKEALKTLIYLTAKGEKTISYLMLVIHFIIPLQDHYMKKLLLIFWEVIPKTFCGAPMEEFILLCDAFRKDLRHPNEFVRGSTLRFLCKLKEPEILEPLIFPVRDCLNHKVPYVRKNAVLAILSIYKSFNALIPDAPELIEHFLTVEKKKSCKRNAFIMLLQVDKEKALNYLFSSIDQVNSLDATLQIVIIELIKKVCQKYTQERSLFIKCIYSLLNSKSSSVRYEAAGALIMLSRAPSAVKATASAYIDLILKESNNTTKLIVMDRLVALKSLSVEKRIMQDLVLDILLLVIKNVHQEVKIKVISMSLELLTEQNIEPIVAVIKKEATRELFAESKCTCDNYSKFLVKSLHSACIRFPQSTSEIIPTLIEFLQHPKEEILLEILHFLKEIVHKYDSIRPLVLKKLLKLFSRIKSDKAYCGALWILAEYIEDINDIMFIVTEIRETLECTIFSHNPDSIRSKLMDEKFNGKLLDETDKKLLTKEIKEKLNHTIIQSLTNGNHFIIVLVGNSLTKLAMKYNAIVHECNLQFPYTEVLLILTSTLNFCKSLTFNKPTRDDLSSLLLNIKIVSNLNISLYKKLINEYRQATSIMLSTRLELNNSVSTKTSADVSQVQVDEPIPILQYFSQMTTRVLENTEMGLDKVLEISQEFAPENKLKKVTQLTGFSDPIYSEAYILPMNEHSILLDVIIVNQTYETLENCTLELAALGDLTIVEKPQTALIAPFGFSNQKAKITIASTENEIIFGNIVYGISGATERSIVVLNDIRIEIIDYIVPGNCSEQEFRQMWTEFEWENKVYVRTNLEDLESYLDQLTALTRMKCVTPKRALTGNCNFMTANLHAKSIFGEDALANVSIEKQSNNQGEAITGYIRVRGKTQGIVISLGDIIGKFQT